MKRRRGFTLVELLVVIGIIVALISILLPAMTTVRHQAKTVQCLANLRQLQLAFLNYVGNINDGQSVCYGVNNTNGTNLWLPEIRQGGSVDRVRFCPEATDIAASWGSAATSWTYTANKTYPIGYTSGSYGINGWLYADDPHGAITSHFVLTKGWPSNVPVFSDSTWIDGWPAKTNPPPADVLATATTATSSLGRICIDRHHRAINVVYLGGNAETVSLQQLWTLNWSNGYVPPATLPIIPLSP